MMNQLSTDCPCVHSVALALFPCSSSFITVPMELLCGCWTRDSQELSLLKAQKSLAGVAPPLCVSGGPLFPGPQQQNLLVQRRVPQPAEELPGDIPFSGQSSQPLLLVEKHSQTRFPLVLCFRTPETFLFPDRLGWSEPPTCSQHGIPVLALPP